MTARVWIAGLLIVGLVLPSEGAVRRRRRTAAARDLPGSGLVLPSTPGPMDRTIAQAAERALRGRAGAVVAMDPRTGRVQAIVNPNYGVWRAYQPCSVFKVVVALAGLSEGVITPGTHVNCAKGCWMWPGHGPIDLRRALAVSCNPFFERVGERLGYETVQRYARLLGLGETSGINLTGEVPGRLPGQVGPEAVGHLSSHAAGITTTAIQIAVLLSAVINGGTVFQPQIAGPSELVPRERWRLPPGTLYTGLAEGFLSAVNDGSASPAFDPEILVAGKTGSCSQVGWFASYAPADQPELVLVVFVRGGNGHLASAVAGRIYQDIYKPTPAPATAVGGR